MTFHELCAMEPRLVGLYDEAKSCRFRVDRCTNDVWYGEFKPRVVDMIGRYRTKEGPEALFSSLAYEVVTDTLYSALPDCPDGGCDEHHELRRAEEEDD